MSIELQLKNKVLEAIQQMYGQSVNPENIQIQKTRKDFEGDFTLVVFPLLRISKKPPEQTATEIGEYLKENISDICEFNVIKGFLNLTLNTSFWISFLNSVGQKKDYGFITDKEKPNTVLVEYSSPNTNKPLHLGHIRNNLLGYSIAKIIASQGDKAIKVNLVKEGIIWLVIFMLSSIRNIRNK